MKLPSTPVLRSLVPSENRPTVHHTTGNHTTVAERVLGPVLDAYVDTLAALDKTAMRLDANKQANRATSADKMKAAVFYPAYHAVVGALAGAAMVNATQDHPNTLDRLRASLTSAQAGFWHGVNEAIDYQEG